ncbi:MAG: hypothetical protein MR347_00120 [[Clostridium] symbiosum]|nr:hypothetical protein [[Clostridium] symbiosum]
MRECVKKLREEWKIKLAWVMICTILLQALAGWRVIPVMAGETEKMDLSGYGDAVGCVSAFQYVDGQGHGVRKWV